jgi:hypothetical protein
LRETRGARYSAGRRPNLDGRTLSPLRSFIVVLKSLLCPCMYIFHGNKRLHVIDNYLRRYLQLHAQSITREQDVRSPTSQCADAVSHPMCFTLGAVLVKGSKSSQPPPTALRWHRGSPVGSIAGPRVDSMMYPIFSLTDASPRYVAPSFHK